MADAELRILCGPTAAGKSAIALSLARRYRATIISADSRQIYRGFDLGTAKPTVQEQQTVPHRGIDIIDPSRRYSAAAWADDAVAWIDEARREGRTPLVVGGTGFYLRALAMPLFEEPALDERARKALGGVLDNMTTATLRRWCEQLDPARAHLGRTQLLRAIEIATLTGRRISEWHREHERMPTVRARWLVVNPSAEVLAQRIAHRTREMLEQGWIEEVRSLLRHVPRDAPAWNATGYTTVREHVEGALTREAMIERIVIDTRQYAKRQRTWFRHQLPATGVTHLDPETPDAADRAHAWWADAREYAA